jgi:hypothetical protein
VSFAAITLCVASQRVFVVVDFVTTQSGDFWIHPRITDADQPMPRTRGSGVAGSNPLRSGEVPRSNLYTKTAYSY